MAVKVRADGFQVGAKVDRLLAANLVVLNERVTRRGKAGGKAVRRTGKVELLPDALRYRGKTLAYSTIVHIGRYARRTRVNFIPFGDYLRLRLYFDGAQKPITLRNTIGLVGTSTHLSKIYERLAEITFQQRFRSYLGQIERMGFFEYANAKFFPAGEVSLGSHRLNLHKAKLWIMPFEFVLKEPKGFFRKKHRISTDIDQDVFLALLKQLYGITFSK